MRISLDGIVRFHTLGRLLTFGDKFIETIVKEFFANIPKNIGKVGESI